MTANAAEAAMRNAPAKNEHAISTTVGVAAVDLAHAETVSLGHLSRYVEFKNDDMAATIYISTDGGSTYWPLYATETRPHVPLRRTSIKLYCATAAAYRIWVGY